MSQENCAVRIAQVAPLYESTPPRLYGGTERVVSYLTEELVRQGHQVTLFASGDSITAAELIAPCDRVGRSRRPCNVVRWAIGILVEMGKCSPQKRVDRAIETSQRVGMPIRIAAKVDRVDAEYFQWKIKPLLDHPLVEIAFRNGSVPEIIEDGTTGFVVTSVEQAVDGLRNGSRRRIRRAAAIETR
jgi:glycosyltransferase involved in cell wall biosynthesis